MLTCTVMCRSSDKKPNDNNVTFTSPTTAVLTRRLVSGLSSDTDNSIAHLTNIEFKEDNNTYMNETAITVDYEALSLSRRLYDSFGGIAALHGNVH